MRKIFTIAAREYRAMVGTKAFLISIMMMPVLMFGSILMTRVLTKVGDLRERRILVYDGGNGLFSSLEQASRSYNEQIRRMAEGAVANEHEEDSFPSMMLGELFALELADRGVPRDEDLVELSRQIRAEQLYAFVEIPPGFASSESTSSARFYSLDSSIASARSWFRSQLNDVSRRRRLKKSFSDEQVAEILAAEQPVEVEGLGLVERAADGSIMPAQRKNELADIFLPMGIMMLMFMVIFMAAQPMLESVLEEKSQRIAEVLLGSVSPFQLMSGKLFGTVSGSLTIFGIYSLGLYFISSNRGWLSSIPVDLLPWFIVYQALGVLFYASIFMAVGASVSQLKEAQSMLLPVWLVLMIPMFVWLLIIRDPNGALAKWLSLFPPCASTTMVLRLATGQTVPTWQIIVSLLLLIVTTLAVIVLAGRIFRVGILWQGKVPRIGEVLRWALRGE